MKLYTKEMFLIAAEKCEVSMIDAKHIMQYIDEYVTPIILEAMEEYKNQPIVDKEQQAKLLSEIMQSDDVDGLYEQPISKMETTQTAVEWLVNWMSNNQYFIGNDLLDAIEQAKQMEKEQLNIARLDGINLANKGYGEK